MQWMQTLWLLVLKLGFYFGFINALHRLNNQFLRENLFSKLHILEGFCLQVKVYIVRKIEHLQSYGKIIAPFKNFEPFNQPRSFKNRFANIDRPFLSLWTVSLWMFWLGKQSPITSFALEHYEKIFDSLGEEKTYKGKEKTKPLWFYGEMPFSLNCFAYFSFNISSPFVRRWVLFRSVGVIVRFFFWEKYWDHHLYILTDCNFSSLFASCFCSFFYENDWLQGGFIRAMLGVSWGTSLGFIVGGADH